MSRVEEICVRHRPSQNSSYNEEILINNIQDINKTLAMLYDLEVKASEASKEAPNWLIRMKTDITNERLAAML